MKFCYIFFFFFFWWNKNFWKICTCTASVGKNKNIYTWYQEWEKCVQMSLQAWPIRASLFIRSTGCVDLRAEPEEERAPLILCMADRSSEKEMRQCSQLSLSCRNDPTWLLEGRIAFCRMLWIALLFPQLQRILMEWRLSVPPLWCVVHGHVFSQLHVSYNNWRCQSSC